MSTAPLAGGVSKENAPVTDAGRSTSLSPGNLALYELQKPFVEPMLRLFRLNNTALDILFYDVGVLAAALSAKGTTVETDLSANLASAGHPPQTLDLNAMTNPSGSIIVVDADLAPYVSTPYVDMKQFLKWANGPEGGGLHTLTITGVGSSAYGSVAFAWNVSRAFSEPVAAIVPGYGLADVVPQALGGWFGFEMYDALQSATQGVLAHLAPSLAIIGKDLALSTPGRQMASTGAPVFHQGSAASDDVHAILEAVPRITRVVGHSKGALAIENALRSLPTDPAHEISVLTFGCVIAEERVHTNYTQYLGWIDALGILNSSGTSPEFRSFSHHSTNTFIPFSMPVTSSIDQIVRLT